MMQLKLLGKQEQTKPKSSKWREIINIRAEINGLKIKKKLYNEINETKMCSFEKFNKIKKPIANMTRKRREKTQIIKISDGKGGISTNTNEIQI
jgi:hypothetical protein